MSSVSKSIFKSIFKGPFGNAFGSEGTSYPYANLLAFYNGVIDDGKLIAYRPVASHTTQQVKGSAFTGAGTGAVTGLLATDTITSQGTAPTCSVNGTLTISADCWDVYVHRAGVLWAYWPGINVGQTTELDASGNGHHLTALTTTVITERLDGGGTNYVNEAGYSHRENLLSYALVSNTDIHITEQSDGYTKLLKLTSYAAGCSTIYYNALAAKAEATTYVVRLALRKIVGVSCGTYTQMSWHLTGSGVNQTITKISGPGSVRLYDGHMWVQDLSETVDTVVELKKTDFVIGTSNSYLFIYPAGIIATVGAGCLIKYLQVCKGATAHGYTTRKQTPYWVQPKSMIGIPVAGKIVGVGDSLCNGHVTSMDTEWFNGSIFVQAGVGGNTSAMVLARFVADVVAQNPDVCFMVVGVNDALASIPAATILANVQSIVALANAAGIQMVLQTIAPFGAHTSWTAPIQAIVDEYNAELIAYGAANGIPVADNYTTMASPGTDNLLAAYADADQLHFSTAGYIASAFDLKNAINLVWSFSAGDIYNDSIQYPGPLGLDATVVSGTTLSDAVINAPLGPEFQAIAEWTNNASVDLAVPLLSRQTRIGSRGVLIYDQPLTYADAVKADRYLGYTIPAEVVHLWNAKEPTTAGVGPQPVYSAASTQPDADGNLVTWPNYVAGRGVEVHPAYTQYIPYTEPVILDQLSNKSAVTIETSSGGLAEFVDNVVVFGANTINRWANQGVDNVADAQVFSLLVEMDDRGAPVPSLDTTSGDFALLMNGSANGTTVSVTQVSETVYRIVSKRASTGPNVNFGILKYTGNSARTFKVSQYNLTRPGNYLFPYIKAEGQCIIVAIGDSITFGDYPLILQTSHPTATVIDSGVNGDTTQDVINRLQTAVYDHTPRAVTLMVGINDILNLISLVTIKANTATIVSSLLSKGYSVVISTITPWKDYVLWTQDKQLVTDEYNAWIISNFSATARVTVVDSYSNLEDPANADKLLPAYDSGDHLHPSAAGNAVIASVFDAAVSWVTFPTSVASTAATSAGNGMAFPMDSRMLECFQKSVTDGVELITNAADREFSSDTGWWTKAGTVSISGGLCTISGGVSNYIYKNIGIAVNRAYLVEFDVISLTGTCGVEVHAGAMPVGEPITTLGRKSVVLNPWTVNGNVLFGATAGTGAVSIDNISIQRLQPAVFTAAALVNMQGSSAEVTADTNILAVNNNVTGGIYMAAGGVLKSFDGTNYATVTVAGGWPRDEEMLICWRINAAGTNQQIGYKKSAESTITWGTAAAYDGSVNPGTHLRYGYTIDKPVGIIQSQVWSKSVGTDAEILNLLRYA